MAGLKCMSPKLASTRHYVNDSGGYDVPRLPYAKARKPPQEAYGTRLNDGAAALEKFNETGGITIVQAPKSAERPEMPEAAIHTGLVDYVLAPGAIAAELERIALDFRDGASAAAN